MNASLAFGPNTIYEVRPKEPLNWVSKIIDSTSFRTCMHVFYKAFFY